MTLRDKKTALLIIDVQKGFDNEAHWGGNRNNRMMEENIQKLLETWRILNLPIFHVKHNSTNIGSPLHPSNAGNEIKTEVSPKPEEIVIGKNVNSAFIGTNLEEQLISSGIKTLVITGIQTDHCVSTTARMASNLSFETFVVSDATATFDRTDLNGVLISSEIIHNINLTSLQDEFATIVTTGSILSQALSLCHITEAYDTKSMAYDVDPHQLTEIFYVQTPRS